MSPARLLLVEDDPVLGRALEMGLQHDGLLVNWRRNGVDAMASFEDGAYDALVVDVGLPGMDGFEMLHRVRQLDIAVPVVIITARGAVEDRIRGLDFGADDYLTKPFELVELLARLRAVERRVERSLTPLTAGSVVLNLSNHVVTVAGEPLTLSAREFSLLRLIMASPQELSWAQIAGYLDFVGDHVDRLGADRYVQSLAQKTGLGLEKSRRGWRCRLH